LYAKSELNQNSRRGLSTPSVKFGPGIKTIIMKMVSCEFYLGGKDYVYLYGGCEGMYVQDLK
jgi:hypothetical protein